MSRSPIDRLAELEATCAGLKRRLDVLEAGTSSAGRHVPASEAAKRLGVDVRTVRRLVEEGQLLGRKQRLPGSERKRWVVNAVALERLESAAECPAGAPAARGRASGGSTT